jgi:hypothetical protein
MVHKLAVNQVLVLEKGQSRAPVHEASTKINQVAVFMYI